MDALDKLFSKLNAKEQLALLEFYKKIEDPKQRKLLDIKKLAGGEFYRARKGNFRVIFHFEGNGVRIDATRIRSGKTYRDF